MAFCYGFLVWPSVVAFWLEVGLCQGESLPLPTVDKWAVCILLECFLVNLNFFLSIKMNQ